jgi:hypothetical protein
MAKITITIEDTDQGTVVVFDKIPEFDNRDPDLTDAQELAKEILLSLEDEESGFEGGPVYHA